MVAVPAPGEGVGYWAGSLERRARRRRHVRHRATASAPARRRRGSDGRRALRGRRAVHDRRRRSTRRASARSRWSARRSSAPTTAAGASTSAAPTPAPSKHWWIDVLEADDPAGFADAEARTVFPGDEHVGVKDPLVQRVDGGWQRVDLLPPARRARRGGPHDHGLRDERATGSTGSGTAPCWRRGPGPWDARGARADRRPARRPRRLRRPRDQGGELVRAHRARAARAGRSHRADVRRRRSSTRATSTSLPLPDGGYRIYYEARLPDESHELRTELIPPRTRSSARRASPVSVPSPTQATYPSGRISTAAGAATWPRTGSSHAPA